MVLGQVCVSNWLKTMISVGSIYMNSGYVLTLGFSPEVGAADDLLSPLNSPS